MPWIKLKKDVIYKDRKYQKGDCIEVGEELAGKMILSGQGDLCAEAKSVSLESLTKKELEELCKKNGLKDCTKMKKAELIAALRAEGVDKR